MTDLNIREVRTRPAGAVLDSDLTTAPQITGGTDILNADEPLQDLIDRLERAGATLLALPATGPSTRLRMTRYDCV
jgi:hypothetical protein